MKQISNQKILSEFLGTFLLVLTVVGSGIMGENLSDNLALTLLGNSLATGAILFVIITMFINISGAYFNPAVVISDLINRKLNIKIASLFIFAQIIGGILGCLIANFYFEINIFQWSTNERFSISTFISEILATFGLILTIIIISTKDKDKVALAVALYITAGYWFTSSTSFANPAVTIARMFTDTFTGIHPGSVLYFILAQIIGAIMATFIAKYFINTKN
tara:strand:+ start:720 stop:1382 length:663 start_codon:yes stop_codon:yes gene_type:complete